MTHPKSLSTVTSFAALAFMLFALAACDCVQCLDDQPMISMPATSFILMAPLAPPPAQFEEIPENQSPRTMIWRPGYWDYSGSSFRWVSGEFIDRPSPTAVWATDRWVEHTYGWGFVPGHWQ